MRRDNPNGYWFLTKRYGYGWGAPVTRQGWLTLLPLPVILVLPALLPARLQPLVLLPIALQTALLLWAVRAHGEPPRWRWGNDDPGPVHPVFPRHERDRLPGRSRRPPR